MARNSEWKHLNYEPFAFNYFVNRLVPGEN